MAERSGRIKEYHTANRQGVIAPDDGGPEVRFYRSVLGDPLVEPCAGYLVTFDAPAVRMNKKRQAVQDPATSVVVTDTSHPVVQKTVEARTTGRRPGRLRDEKSGRRRSFADRAGSPAGGRQRPPKEWSPRERKTSEAAEHVGVGSAEKKPAALSRASQKLRPGGSRRVPAKGLTQRRAVVRQDRKDLSSRHFLRPLPFDIRIIIRDLSQCAISPALLLDKYARSVPPQGPGVLPEQSLITNLPEQERLSFLKNSFTAGYRSCWENRAAWQAMRRRHAGLWRALSQTGYRGASWVMQSSQPLSVQPLGPGLFGAPGIELHRTYGFPFLPAVWIRSLLLGFIEGHPGRGDSSFEQCRQACFGQNGRRPALSILDAMPLKPPVLQIEGSDEAKSGIFGEEPPDRMLFAGQTAPRLCIAKGTGFIFSLLLEPDGEMTHCSWAQDLLRAALEEKGFTSRQKRPKSSSMQDNSVVQSN